MQKIFSILCVCLIVLTSCSKSKNVTSTEDSSEQTSVKKVDQAALPVLTKTKTGGNESTISGQIIDENKEPMPFAVFMLTDASGKHFGSVSDVDGMFVVKNIPNGEYNIEIRNVGYHSSFYGPLVLETGYEIVCKPNGLQVMEIEVIVLKPVIYLYPEDTVEVNLQLQYNGELIHTYPRYAEDGWHITAYPDGTLRDANDRSYYALYWEGRESYTDLPDCGNVVAGDASITFLEESLDALGLTNREANEFIMYWLPLLEKNPYNLIHFATTTYEASVPIDMSPVPDQSIRIMMTMVPLQKPITYPVQQIEPMNTKRDGFVLVEWGGQIRQAEELTGLMSN